jgi:hypothetical protein
MFVFLVVLLLLLLIAAGPDLSVQVNGLKLPNPFVIGSGPPGTNYQVMKKAFDEGWGAVICKTLSLDSSKVCCLRQLAHDSMLAPAEVASVILHQHCSSSTVSSNQPGFTAVDQCVAVGSAKTSKARLCVLATSVVDRHSAVLPAGPPSGDQCHAALRQAAGHQGRGLRLGEL